MTTWVCLGRVPVPHMQGKVPGVPNAFGPSSVPPGGAPNRFAPPPSNSLYSIALPPFSWILSYLTIISVMHFIECCMSSKLEICLHSDNRVCAVDLQAMRARQNMPRFRETAGLPILESSGDRRRITVSVETEMECAEEGEFSVDWSRQRGRF